MNIFPAMLMLLAAETPSSSNALVDAVEACRKIGSDRERLVCFDRSTAAMAEARQRRELLVMDKTQVRKTRRSLFGFTIPSFKLFGGSDKDDEAEDFKQIESKTVSGAPSGYNQYTVTIEDGSVWQTTEESPGFSPRRGDVVKIRRTAFGYMAKSGYSQARIRRVK